MSADEHLDEHHHEQHAPDVSLAALTAPPLRKLDMAAVRAKLQAKSGKQYWRTIEELAEDPAFEEFMHREFPRHASEWDNSVDRRDFLKLMGASLAFAGMAGCGAPQQHIVPYVKQPDGMVPGNPLFFATTVTTGADSLGILVESHEGRPTKIEGNPDHPGSLGATDAFAQAAILDLYDPDRAKTITFLGEIRNWEQFSDAAAAMAAGVKVTDGSGFRVLTGAITSDLTRTAQRRSLSWAKSATGSSFPMRQPPWLPALRSPTAVVSVF